VLLGHWQSGQHSLQPIHRETYFFQCHRRVGLRHSLRDEANGDKVLEINALSSAQQCFREFGNLKEKEIPTLS
jgi:hypothetical protein